MTQASDLVIELDLGCLPEAAVSGAVLVQTERSTLLTFNAMRRRPDGRREPAGTAMIEFLGCSATRFGYPNDEARAGIPRFASVSYGIYEVLHSSWLDDLARQNRHSFPSLAPRRQRSRHFLLGFHDSTFECLADDLRLTLADEPYRQVFARIAERIVAE